RCGPGGRTNRASIDGRPACTQAPRYQAALEPVVTTTRAGARPGGGRRATWSGPALGLERAAAEPPRWGPRWTRASVGGSGRPVAHEAGAGRREARCAMPGATDGAAARVAGALVTSPERLVYPEAGLSKRDLAEYLEAVGEALLRRASRRPLAVVRCPEGVAGHCFYQKHPSESFAPDLPRLTIEEKEGPDEYFYVESVAHLVSLAQLGVVELHVWGSRVDDLERPDLLVFDLDPSPGVPFAVTKRTARRLRERLDALGLAPYLRATGGKGLHVVAPLVPQAGWDEVKRFAEAVAGSLAAEDPEHLTTALPKERREGKVFIDYLRNGRGATAVADYSPRARAGASVAVPLRWDELGRLPASAAYDLRKARRRLASLGDDPWAGFEASAVPLATALAAGGPARGAPGARGRVVGAELPPPPRARARRGRGRAGARPRGGGGRGAARARGGGASAAAALGPPPCDRVVFASPPVMVVLRCFLH